MAVEVFARQTDVLGEGPIWSEDQCLYWLDIARKRVQRKANAADVTQSWSLPEHPGCLAALDSNRVAVVMRSGVFSLDIHSGALRKIIEAPPCRPATRFNDGKVDPRGSLWAGTMQNNYGPHGEAVNVERRDGALFRFGAGEAVLIEENIGIANTLAWSPDHRRFYFADSLSGEIYVYDADPESGSVSNKRVFFGSHGRGIPDGSAMDVDGCLWNARWDGSAILRITPEGRVDRTIELPVPRPTSCAFGGSDLDVLFVTTATDGLSRDQLSGSPLSGAVLAITGLAQGVLVPRLSTRAFDRCK